LHTRGEIFFHPEYEFENGGTSNKLFVLLNTPTKNQNYLFVKTTSRQTNKPLNPGCIKRQSLFFIPAGRTWFYVNTWVQLRQIYEMSQGDINKDENARFTDGSLNNKTVDKIIDCLFITQDEDIPPIQRKLLRPPFYESILKLKERFNS
jgi:hypothetical protein